MQSNSITSIFKISFNHWRNHRSARMGAALSYYTIFSIVPLLMLLLIISRPFLANDYIQTAIVEQVSSLVNIKTADFIQSILVGLSNIKFNFLMTITGIGILILGTVGVFYELKSSLDDLWDTRQPQTETKNWKYFFSSHFLSLSMIPILGFLLAVSVFFSLFLGFISGYSSVFNDTTLLFHIVSFIFSYFILSCLFVFVFRFLPRKKLPWSDLIKGAMVTTILFIVGKVIISFYLSKISGVSFFGAAEALAILLLWIFYSVQIFLFGASFTYIYSITSNQIEKED
ncbi:MAG: YihY/virulence factor BrkB family protein [Candidatus Pacebacteria bacterium]|nr:YihY/virulence factor BrkB family protein [Candidatus Paceibacterota bacterium]